MGDARETEKAPDAFRTISEVADDLDLPQHVLRFWETRFPQIRPVKRAGGRRFYRPEDVDLLRGIRHLLYTDGFTIKGAQRVLKDQGVRYVQDLGIEREVAVMRSAKPGRGEEGEGVTFGGLLGLLPRRRPKGRAGQGDDAGLPDLPEAAELPLPFPDPEADRDLAHEPEVPPMALRAPAPSALRAPAPSAQTPSGRGRQAPAERRDPVFEPAPDRRREPRFDEPRPEGRAFDDPDPEAAPFEAPRHRDARPGEPRAREPRFDDMAGRDDDVRARPSRSARTGDARDPRRREEPAFRPAAPEDVADYDDADDAGREEFQRQEFRRDDFSRDDFPRDDFGHPDAARREFSSQDRARQDRALQDRELQDGAPQDRARRDRGRPDARAQAAPRDDFGFPDIEPAPSAPRDRAPREPAPDAWPQDSLRHGREIQRPAHQDPSRRDPLHQDPDPRPYARGLGRDEPVAPDSPARGRGGVDAGPMPAARGAAPWPEEPYEPRPEEPRPARRERVEPVLAPRRPTRGPASRLDSLGRRPGEEPASGGHGALDDPLLPFFEDTPGAAPSVSEPIEARIQRLRAQERRPARPYDDGQDTSGPDASGTGPVPAAPEPPPGPPEEFIPPRARRQPDAAAAQPLPPQAAMAPRPPRREAPERVIQDGEWRQTDWVDTAWEDDPFAPPPARGPSESHAGADPRAAAAPHPRFAPAGRPAPPPPADDDPEIDMMEQERRRPPVSLPQDEWREPAAGARAAPPPPGPARRSAGDSAYPPEAYARAPHSQPPHSPLHADPAAAYGSDPQPAPRGRAFAPPGQMAAGGSDVEQEARRVWDEGWGENAPQALPRATRVGPLIGPILEEEPSSPHDVMPEEEQRRMADRMAGRPVAEPPAQRRAPPWVRPDSPAEPHGPVRAEPAHGAEPAQRVAREPQSRESMPREPLRAGPPEQYLPPHLRSEPRVGGQPPMAAPVLSRDDVHRMQSALYELGECRRLMEGVLAGKDARTAD